MPVNAYIPLSGHPVNIKPINPMQQMAQLAAIKSQQTQNKLAQMGLDKKMALDNAAKSSFDANGIFNNNKYIQNLSQVDPIAAQNYQQAQKLQSLKMKESLASMKDKELSGAMKRAKVIGKASGSLLNQYHAFLKQNGGNVQAAKQAMQPYYMKEMQMLEKQYGIKGILKEHPIFDPSTAKFAYDQTDEAIKSANQIKLARVKKTTKAPKANEVELTNGQKVTEATLKSNYQQQFTRPSMFGGSELLKNAPTYGEWRNSQVKPKYARKLNTFDRAREAAAKQGLTVIGQ